VWRYSRIDELDLERYSPVRASGEPLAEVPPELSSLLDAIGPRSGLVLARNGRLCSLRLGPELEVAGVGVSAADGTAADRVGSVAASPDALVELAAAFVVDPLVVEVPSRVSVERPLVVLNWLDAEGGAVFPRTVVRVGDGGSAAVVEVVASPDVASLAVPVTELDVGDDAELSYVTLQETGPRAWCVSYHSSRVARDATLQSLTVALGGDYSRVRTDSRLTGQGGSTRLLAAYFGSGGQVQDFRTLQDHDAPKTTSDLLFKGAVTDDARSVYSGLIRVRKGAVGSDAFQTNRNLVLSEGAHADSVPNLDIEENDVRCSHASAVSPIDEEQRYYLETRGVPSEAADRLVVLGFFGDLLGRCTVAGVEGYVRSRISARLAARPAAELAHEGGGR
jgi:Fe-S cluster assembly protein SufD